MRKTLLSAIASLALPAAMNAQGWPANFQGVMLQGFYWNSFDASNWQKLKSQAGELSQYFRLIWIPQSGNCGHESMGYDDLYWFSNYKSAFGSESELRSMISTFKQKGLGTVADVVINHRSGVSNLVDFPKETYKGVTYQLLSTDICKDDDGGNTATWAAQNGFQLSSNNDTGEDASFARDLDHNSINVQNNVEAYLDFLLNDLGYEGVRYDMVKGYAPKFTGMYNATAKPTFSVGEYFDGNKQLVINWLNGTKVDNTIQSAAFDFPFRYSVRDAANYGNWTKLANGGLATDTEYNRYAVTFVENHDTEKREDSNQDPIKSDTLAANAYMLAMPGTPCVFLKHWIDCKQDIKNMILLRNLTGINNQSTWISNESTVTLYAFTTEGTNGKLHAVVGTRANSYMPDASQWALVADGWHYRYFIERSTETAWTSLPSGEYFNDPQAILYAASKDDNARIVYTLDGSTPTASSTSVANGTAVNLPSGDFVMKAGLLANGIVTGVIERHYNIKSFKPYEISVNVNADDTGWRDMNFWTWGGDGTHNPENATWPGDKVTTTTVNGDKTWYTRTYTMNSKDDYVNFVFSTGNGIPQTENIQNINTTSYFIVTTEKDNNGHQKVKNVTDTYASSVSNAIADRDMSHTSVKVYTVNGTLLRTLPATATETEATATLPSGIYIVNGKKIVK